MVFVPIGTEERIRRKRFPFMNMIIVILNIIVFAYEMYIFLFKGEMMLSDFIQAFGVVPASIISGQSTVIPFYFTLVTSMFLHAGFTHIGFNMAYLLAFGDNVEDRLGHGGYLIFYLVSGLFASFAQIWVDPTSTIPAVGASGAIAGVLAGYFLLFPRGIVKVFVFLGLFATMTRVRALIFIGLWFVLQFFSGIASLGIATAETGGVAYWVYIGGFITGFILALMHRLFSHKNSAVRTYM